MQRFIVNITQENFDLIGDKYVGCFIVSEKLEHKFIVEFVKKAREHNQLVLICGAGAADTLLETGGDGLFLDVSTESDPQKTIKSARDNFPDIIIGAVCRNRRHEAMLVSECEPDFVAFRVWNDGIEKTLELLEWYYELFLLQSAVIPMDDMDAKQFKSDFVIVDEKKYKKM